MPASNRFEGDSIGAVHEQGTPFQGRGLLTTTTRPVGRIGQLQL